MILYSTILFFNVVYHTLFYFISGSYIISYQARTLMSYRLTLYHIILQCAEFCYNILGFLLSLSFVLYYTVLYHIKFYQDMLNYILSVMMYIIIMCYSKLNSIEWYCISFIFILPGPSWLNLLNFIDLQYSPIN